MAVMYGELKKGEVKALLKKEFDKNGGKMSLLKVTELLNSKGVRTVQGKEYNIHSAGYLVRSLGFRQKKKRKSRVVNQPKVKQVVGAAKRETSFNKISLAEMVLTHQLLPEGRKLDLLGEILKL